ncbi:MAG: hypothetical protein EXS35_11235 [Pedosphaera sp.]|nr:hypothetical protein [Pedosphaera sp.]
MHSRLTWFVALVFTAISSVVHATPDLKFDVVTFCCPCSVDDHLCQPQFDHLNWPTTNGSFVAMGSDAHRLELATNGNALAIYYNTFNDGYSTNSAAAQAALIQNYATNGFTATGPRPDWIMLNELSSGLWTGDAAYRPWAAAVVRELKTNYGFNVILFSPFPNPGNNNSDWQAVSSNAFIAIENYLDGAQIKANGYSVSWCQGQYQSSITSYTNRGVPRAKLILTEHFAQTVAGTNWGRSGISSNEWDQAISARSLAAKNVAFPGFATYAWAKNAMLVGDDEIIHFEDAYRTNPLPFAAPLSAPFVVHPPQSQIVPPGADVGFIAFKAGTAPTTYQWRLNGANLAGATSSTLNLTNVGPLHAGNYSVILSNVVGSIVSSNALLSVTNPPPLAFDPFAPAITSYALNANLVGQTNATGQYWTQAGPAGVQPTITSNNLSYAGLATSMGNSVKFGGNGMSARFNFGAAITSGTVYFSFLAKLTDISTLNSSGVFWAGFNNSTGTQLTTPSTVGTRVLTKSATGGYQIGLDKTSGNAGGFVFAPNVFTTAQTVFLVGSYTFNPAATNDDVSQLWINPAPATFGSPAPPAATLINTATNDISNGAGQIASFVLFNRNANEPAQIIADEVRIGTNWASVTPPAIPPAPPTLAATLAAGKILLAWTTNAPDFTLESAAALTNGVSWSAVGAPVNVIGNQFVVTNNTSAAASFFRLRWP